MSEPPHVLAVTLVNERREIGRLLHLVEAFGRSSGLNEDDIADAGLLLDEFVSNVIKYGYDDAGEHEIRVIAALEGRQLTIRIEDEGKAFNPLEAGEPDLTLPIEERPIGGLGILIAKTLADSIAYERTGGRNVLTVRKALRDPSSGA
jgi:anti-sigma regulatory factor (Ser/Thr protein kinase)